MSVLLIRARQLALYVPSLISIENQYYAFGEETVIEEATKFQAYLQERGYFPDELRLPDLGQFAADVYSVGTQICQFNINLLHSYESPYHYNSQIEKIRAAVIRQSEIFELCKEFLRSRRY